MWRLKEISWWMWVTITPAVLISDLILHIMGKMTLSGMIWAWKGTETGAFIFFALGGLCTHFIFGRSGNG